MAKRAKKKSTGEKVEPWGTIYPSVGKGGPLFFRQCCGSAERPSGEKYDMDANMGGGDPIVTSKQTGKRFTLSWNEIITMAVDAGIDKED